MCERFSLSMTSTELSEYFQLFREPKTWKPRFNISPMKRIMTVREKADGNRYSEVMQWGLVPSWANHASIGFEMATARSNLVVSRRTFRGAFRLRRCLIPATGYYVWQNLKDNEKRPWYIFPKDEQPIAFAGIWESWRLTEVTPLLSCSIITTDANRLTRSLSSEMPVILPLERWNQWLNLDSEISSDLAKLLVAYPNALLEKIPVSSYIDNPRNDSPECIRPVLEVRQ